MLYNYDFYKPSAVVFGEHAITKVPGFLKRFAEIAC